MLLLCHTLVLQSGSSVLMSLWPDAAVVKHSAAVVWQFFPHESLWPDAAVVKHSAAVVWLFFPHESPWPDAAVVMH